MCSVVSCCGGGLAGEGTRKGVREARDEQDDVCGQWGGTTSQRGLVVTAWRSLYMINK